MYLCLSTKRCFVRFAVTGSGGAVTGIDVQSAGSVSVPPKCGGQPNHYQGGQPADGQHNHTLVELLQKPRGFQLERNIR